MYNEIASYYDSFGWSEYSDDCVEIVNTLMMRNKIIPERLYDLACGSAEFIYQMSEIFEDTNFIGVDISEEMTKVAKTKCKEKNNIKIYTEDMLTYSSPKKAEVVTCLFDSINHLLRYSDWEEACKSAYKLLKYEGIFILDFVPLAGFSKWNDTLVNETKDGVMIRKCKFEEMENRLRIDINLFIKTNYFNAYKNIKEVQYETSFDLKKVLEMLKNIGFKNIEIYDTNLHKAGILKGRYNKESRLYLVAKK